MDTCKKCLHYIPNTEPFKTGSCTIIGDSKLIAANQTIVDIYQEDLEPISLEVGEDFGCIHWEYNFIPDEK